MCNAIEWLLAEKSLRSFSAIGYVLLISALLITVILLIRYNFKLTFLLEFIYCLLVSPYVAMGMLLNKHADSNGKTIINCLAITIISSLGLILLANIMRLFPDFKYPMTITIVPLIQLFIIGLFVLNFNLYLRSSQKI
jgi:hypothetical protein